VYILTVAFPCLVVSAIVFAIFPAKEKGFIGIIWGIKCIFATSKGCCTLAAEIIPYEPDADNAAVGNGCLKTS